jgi:predicted nucleic acid-binding protein
MKPVFADSFYFFAVFNPKDAAHEKAKRYAARHDEATVTTAWVLTELADGLAATPYRSDVVRLVSLLRADPENEIVPLTADLMERGLALYDARPDKQWSLTDCISFLVMQDRHITEALTDDRHFEQAGFIALLK